MPDTAQPSILSRKILAHNPPFSAAPSRDPAAARAFGRALRHAAAPFPGLTVELGETHFHGSCTLAAAMDAIPDHGIVVVLEDEAGRRGLLALSNGLVDALIEVQTTGTVEQAALPPRPVTQIDEAMCKDFIDLALAAFARETDEVPGRDWPLRMQFGSRIETRGQITLLLAEGDYRRFDATLAFAGTDRTARVTLAVPADPTLARPIAAKSADAQSQTADPAWTAGLARLVLTAPLTLDAVLLRTTMSFARIGALSKGDIVPFAAADLAAVRLEDGAGRAVLTGRLGQSAGKRAIRPDIRNDRSADGPAAPWPDPMPDPPASSAATPGDRAAPPGMDTAAPERAPTADTTEPPAATP